LLAIWLWAAVPAAACWVEEYGDCRVCGGTGQQACQYCQGGEKTCTFCFGSGQVNVRCPSCGGAGGDCATCGGSGQIAEVCQTCGGTGRIVCSTCGGTGRVTCFFCGGSGQTVVRRYWNENCGQPHGQGLLPDRAPADSTASVAVLRARSAEANLDGQEVNAGHSAVLSKGVAPVFQVEADGRVPIQSAGILDARAPGKPQ
jgi:hypothetical protein